MPLTVWPFPPHTAIAQSLEWHTDIILCAASEQRIALRPTFPRQEYHHKYDLTPARFSRAKALARKLYLVPFQAPRWEERTKLSALAPGATVLAYDSTLTSANPGEQLIVWDSVDNWEVATIYSCDATSVVLTAGLAGSYASPFAMPLATVEFAQEFDVIRETAYSVEASARLVCYAPFDLTGIAGLSYPTHLGIPILTDRTHCLASIAEQFSQENEELDSITGGRSRVATQAYPRQTGMLARLLRTRQELRDYTAWLWTMRGRQKGFWLPSWNADVALISGIAASASTMTVQTAGLTGNVRVPLDIAVIKTDGTLITRRVTGVSMGGGGEVLAFTPAWGASTAAADVDSICIMTLSRMDSDRIELQHSANGMEVTVSSVPTIEVLS